MDFIQENYWPIRSTAPAPIGQLKEKGIKLIAKPLGRPSAVQIHVSPGERNPIEGKFGQAKTAYGLDRIKARLRNTSESWIASIILVLNLVKLAGAALPCLLIRRAESFSARMNEIFFKEFATHKKIYYKMYCQIGKPNRINY